MNKVNGIYLDNDEVLIIQRIIANLLNTSDPNEVAKKVVVLKDDNGKLFDSYTAIIGLFIVDFMRHKAP